LTDTSREIVRRHSNGLFGAITAGFFFLLVGMLFVTIPGLYTEINSFVQDFVSVTVPHTQIALPAPAHPANYLTVYSAAEQFTLVWAVFLVAMFIGRIVLRSAVRRQAQNLGDIVFWFGMSYLIQTFLISPVNSLPRLGSEALQRNWFELWPAVIIVVGISLIARSIFLAAFRGNSHRSS
jgi:hypothetical protein